jgi:hypothetical protein
MASLHAPLHSFRSPNRIGQHDATEVFEQQSHASAVTGVDPTTCPPPLKQGLLSTSRRPRCKKSQQLDCVFENCTHKGTFSGSYELERHVRVKHHDGTKKFVCNAERCFNKQLRQPWTFTRSDKLTAHIKATHTRDTIFAACPVTGCAFGRCTLETLGVHITRVHDKRGVSLRYVKDVEEGRAFLNASSCKVRKCPLWRCGKHVKAPELLGHITKHARDDVLAAIPELKHEGLIVIPALSSSQQGLAQYGLAITVLCPVCNTMSDDVDSFIAHLWNRHLFLAGSDGSDHFIAWRSTLNNRLHKGSQDRISLLLPWNNLSYFDDYPSGEKTVQCPWCSFTFSSLHSQTQYRRAARIAASAHHLSLLRPEAEVVAELYPYRMQILRLYSEFVSHPVFADFDQPQAGTASSSQEPRQFDGAGIMKGIENHGQATTDFNPSF